MRRCKKVIIVDWLHTYVLTRSEPSLGSDRLMHCSMVLSAETSVRRRKRRSILDFGKFAITLVITLLVFAAPSCVGILFVLDAESFGSGPSWFETFLFHVHLALVVVQNIYTKSWAWPLRFPWPSLSSWLSFVSLFWRWWSIFQGLSGVDKLQWISSIQVINNEQVDATFSHLPLTGGQGGPSISLGLRGSTRFLAWKVVTLEWMSKFGTLPGN